MVGKRLPVRYDPENPSDYDHHNDVPAAFGGMVFGVAMGVIGVILYRDVVREPKRREPWPQASGRRYLQPPTK